MKKSENFLSRWVDSANSQGTERYWNDVTRTVLQILTFQRSFLYFHDVAVGDVILLSDSFNLGELNWSHLTLEFNLWTPSFPTNLHSFWGPWQPRRRPVVFGAFYEQSEGERKKLLLAARGGWGSLSLYTQYLQLFVHFWNLNLNDM